MVRRSSSSSSSGGSSPAFSISRCDTNRRRQRIDLWLLRHLDDNSIEGLRWLDKAKGIFRIDWPHKAAKHWNLKDKQSVFEMWTKEKPVSGQQRQQRGGLEQNFRMLKQNFRCAMHSSRRFRHHKELGCSTGPQAHRVYEFCREVEDDQDDVRQSDSACGSPTTSEETLEVSVVDLDCLQSLQANSPDSGIADILSDSPDSGMVDIQSDSPDSGIAGIVSDGLDAGMVDILSDSTDSGMVDILSDIDVNQLAREIFEDTEGLQWQDRSDVNLDAWRCEAETFGDNFDPIEDLLTQLK